MEDEVEIKSLLTKNLVIVEELNKRAQMFTKPMLILSLLDVVFGILAIFCTSLQVVAFFASASSLTAITVCGRLIQVSKINQLNKSLKTLNVVSLAWFVNRYKKFLKKKESGEVKTTKLSKVQIAAIVGAVVGVVFGLVSAFVPQIQIAGNAIYNFAISLGIEAVSAFAGTFKGYAEKTEEEIAKAKAKQEEKAKALEDVEYKKALALREEYDKANAIIAKHEQNK